MGKSKYLCSKCGQKHFPPTGKKCVNTVEEQFTSSTSVSTKNKGQTSQIHMSEVRELNCVRNSCGSLQKDHQPSVIQDESSEDEESAQQSSSVQMEILKQLKRMNDRLDTVEDQVASTHQKDDSQRRKDYKLSKIGSQKCIKSVKKPRVVT